jgi:hypothetical protein
MTELLNIDDGAKRSFYEFDSQQKAVVHSDHS